MTRQEIIDLIRNEYDPAPSDWPVGHRGWDDGCERIADVVMKHIEQLEAALHRIEQSSNDHIAVGIARAARDHSSPPARQENDDVFKGFRGNNEA